VRSLVNLRLGHPLSPQFYDLCLVEHRGERSARREAMVWYSVTHATTRKVDRALPAGLFLSANLGGHSFTSRSILRTRVRRQLRLQFVLCQADIGTDRWIAAKSQRS